MSLNLVLTTVVWINSNKKYANIQQPATLVILVYNVSVFVPYYYSTLGKSSTTKNQNGLIKLSSGEYAPDTYL